MSRKLRRGEDNRGFEVYILCFLFLSLLEQNGNTCFRLNGDWGLQFLALFSVFSQQPNGVCI